jgi:hypothetical protein
MKKEKVIYSYHPVSLAYVGELIAKRSPLDTEEVFLIPRFSTELKPIFEKNKITKFDLKNNKWVLEEVVKPKQKTQKEKEEEEFKSTKEMKIFQCKAYLSKTDWQVVRFFETSEPIKNGVSDNRALARSLQDDIETCKTLEELKNININFE